MIRTYQIMNHIGVIRQCVIKINKMLTNCNYLNYRDLTNLSSSL